MPRAPVTAVIIAKNAAHDLPRCLASIVWVDEIVLVDSGSTDGTQDIAREAGAKVFEYADWPGFGPQRQRAQDHATHDWVFMIDVDEEVSPELRASIEGVLQKPASDRVYVFQRLSDFFGRWIYTSGWYPDPVARLYPRHLYRYDNAPVHEKLDFPSDKQETLKGHLLHYTTSDYRHFAGKSVRYAADWAEARYRRGKRTTIVGILLRSLGCFVRKYLLQRGFMEGRHGLMLAFVSTVYTFNKYTALWTLQQRSPDERAP